MKSSLRLRLKPDARADFLDIGRFTFRQWGALQRDRYSRQVRQALQSLLDFPERGPARDEYFSGCRTLVVGQHVGFYYVTDVEVIVVRILHASRDASDLIVP